MAQVRPAQRPFRLTLAVHDDLRAAINAAARKHFSTPAQWVRNVVVAELARSNTVAPTSPPVAPRSRAA
jgi:hypothetical protein